MLPLAKGLAPCRSTQTTALTEQDGALQPPSPGDAEGWRLRFRQFKYCMAAGPQRALSQLWTLCHLWLQPNEHSQEQILELLVLEQFLGSLPCKMRSWVQSQGPRTCREAANLVEDLTQMFQQEVLVSLDSADRQDRSTGEKEDRKNMKLPMAQSQRDSAQVSELAREAAGVGPPKGDKFLELTQWNLHGKVGVELLGISRALGPEPQPPSMNGLAFKKADRQKKLERGGPRGASTAPPVYLPPKPSIWETPDCWQAEDRPLRNRHPLPRQAQNPAQSSHQPILAAPKSAMLPGPILEGSLRQSPLLLARPNVLTGPQRSNPLKRLGGSDENGQAAAIGLLSLRRTRASAEKTTWATRAAVETKATGGMHAQRAPPSEQPLKCAECGAVFTWVTHFIEHQKAHQREVPFPCPECHKGFLHASVLAEHRKIHLLEPPRKKAHLNEGRQAKPRKTLSRALGQLGNRHEDPSRFRRRYLASHSPERPFRCSLCGKAFPWMAHLLDHQKLHLGP